MRLEMELNEIKGVGEKTIEKLEAEGYKDLMSVAVMPIDLLVEITGLGEKQARNIINTARDELKLNFVNALEYEMNSNIQKIKTGSTELDNLLNGGYASKSITELFGQFSSGKSQLALQATANVLNTGGEVIWCDTEGSLKTSRVRELLTEPDKQLKRLKVVRVFSTDHQLAILDKMPEEITSETKLVVVDSLVNLFRNEYQARGKLADRQQKLNRYLHDLQRLSERYNLVIIVTNQIMRDPSVIYGDSAKPIGGEITAHNVGERLYLRKSKDNTRVAKLIDSSSLPPGEAQFRITKDGITD